MTASRIVEFGFSFLVAFLLLVTLSFVTVRPTLKEVRLEARQEWTDLVKAVAQRNELLPGLLETFRTLEPGHSKLVERSLEARAVSMRSTAPDTVIAAVDDMELQLSQIGKVAQASPTFENHPFFSGQWRKVQLLTQRISDLRRHYNNSARLYNRLLATFPHNLVTTLFGFRPITHYPIAGTLADSEG